MKYKIIALLSLISILLTGCGVASEVSTVSTASNVNEGISIDYSRVINSLPGHDDNLYDSPESLLGVTDEPKKIVGKFNSTSLTKDYEKMAREVYMIYSFEHEDGTASQVYKYYFFNSKEDYDKAYAAFCMSEGSPSIRNEKSLFFGNGGSAELYVTGRPKYNDILLYFQVNSIEIIKSWSSEEPSVEETSEEETSEELSK